MNSDLSRTRLLLGDDATERLCATRVIVFGVGGVGSWCVEALVRSGVRHITIVDPDRVCPSNINRQLMATTSTVGKPKVEVLRDRLLDISPEAEVDARFMAFSADTAAEFNLNDYDYVVDAIDSIADKMLLLALCLSRKGGGQQGCQQSCRRQQGEQMSSAVLFHTRGVLLILYLPGHVPWLVS